jgi:hypothetical protein
MLKSLNQTLVLLVTLLVNLDLDLGFRLQYLKRGNQVLQARVVKLSIG